MNAAVEQIMVVVDTTPDAFAGTTEAEVDSVLVSLKDPLSDTCCGAQPDNRNPQTIPLNSAMRIAMELGEHINNGRS